MKVQNSNVKAWNRGIRVFFKWILISLPVVAATCIGARIVGLIRNLLTLKGVALVVGIVVVFQGLNIVKMHIAHENSPETIIQNIRVLEQEINETIKLNDSILEYEKNHAASVWSDEPADRHYNFKKRGEKILDLKIKLEKMKASLAARSSK